MEEDILNYSPTLMFRGTPCIYVLAHSIRYTPAHNTDQHIELQITIYNHILLDISSQSTFHSI